MNPCICWNLKDGCVTVGLWTLILSLGSLGLFGWQQSVLNKCRTVLIAQVNQMCQEYCPCAGQTTANLSTLVEGKEIRLQLTSVANLAIFGWQTARIKFYKDQEATNARYPEYGRYGTDRREFPAFYETVFQSDLEKFYTGVLYCAVRAFRMANGRALFVIQILCLIVAFFLLFASVALIYGVHTGSRYLAWPWFPCIIASILCSLAYCIMWWTGDIRGYWMVLTIIQIVCVVVNVYCLLCVIVWYRRLVTNQNVGDQAYWEENQKNVYFSDGDDKQQQQYQDPGNTVVYYNNGQPNVEQLPDHQFITAQQQQAVGQYGDGGHLNWAYERQGTPPQDPNQKVELAHYPYQYQDGPGELPPKQPLVGEGEFVQQWVASQQHIPGADGLATTPGDQYESEPNRTAMPTKGGLKPAKSDPAIHKRRPHRHRAHSVESRSRKSSRTCTRCGSDTDSEDSYGRKRTKSRHRSSSHHRHKHNCNHAHGSRSRSRDKYSESDTGYSEVGSHHHSSKHRHRHRQDDDDKSSKKKSMKDVKRQDKERNAGRPDTSASTPSFPPPYGPAMVAQTPPFAPPLLPPPNSGRGISIPQHIVIPPNQGPNANQPQKFHINSEITISYNNSDRSGNPSDAESARGGGRATALAAAATPVVSQSPMPENGSVRVRNRRAAKTSAAAPGDNRDSYGAESSDSKGHGSTAV